MNPGATSKPLASIVSLPRNSFREIARILPPEIPTLRIASRLDSGSITLPCKITTSYNSAARSAASGIPCKAHAATNTLNIHCAILIRSPQLSIVALLQAHQSLRERLACQKKNPESLGVSDPGRGCIGGGPEGKSFLLVNVSRHLANLPQLFVCEEN